MRFPKIGFVLVEEMVVVMAVTVIFNYLRCILCKLTAPQGATKTRQSLDNKLSPWFSQIGPRDVQCLFDQLAADRGESTGHPCTRGRPRPTPSLGKAALPPIIFAELDVRGLIQRNAVTPNVARVQGCTLTGFRQ